MKKFFLLSIVVLFLCSWSFAIATEVSTSNVDRGTQEATMIKASDATYSTSDVEPLIDKPEMVYENPQPPPVITTVLLTEGFEGGALPAGWTDSPGLLPWLYDGGIDYGPNTPHGGAYAAYFNIYDYASGTKDSLITPSLNFSAYSGAYTVTYWGWHESGSDSLVVYLSEAGVLTRLQKMPNSATWAQYSVSFASTSTDGKIIFIGYSNYGIDNLYIDDVEIGDAPSSGRCCYGDPAYPTCDDISQSACIAFGGTWDPTKTCASDPCPSTLGNDCATPIVINIPAQLPFAENNFTCGRGNNYSETALGYYDGGEDIMYQINVTATSTVTIWLDPLGTTWTGMLLDDSCPTDSLTFVAKSTMTGSTPHGLLAQTLEPGTYWLMLDTWPSPNCIPSFDLTIATATECVVTCPPGATPEGEPTCYNDYIDVTNGGCNSTPNVFGTVIAGETVCGTSGTFLSGTSNSRDTDWYTFDLAERKTVTVSGVAQFMYQLLILQSPCPGTQKAVGTAMPCSVATASAVLYPGTYYIWAGPSVFTGVACGSPYYFTVTVTDPPPPPTPDFFVSGAGTWTGNTCGAVDNCDLRIAEEHIYQVTIPSDGLWTFSLCNTPVAWDTYMFLGNYSCLGDIASSDDFCGALSEISANLVAGTYYLTIEGYNNTYCGDYTLDITYTPPAIVTCPPAGYPEGEPACGPDYVDNYNGGCNTAPYMFQNVLDGDIICGISGTFLFSGSNYRDTDWYRIVLTEQRELTWKGVAEFPLQMILLNAGIENCSTTVQVALGTAAAGDTAIATAIADPGVYWLWAGPSVFSGWDCPLDYVAWVSTATPPPPPVNDFCTGAIAVAVPSTTPGSTRYASIDSEFPTCGTTISAPGIWYTVDGTGNTMTATLCDAGTNYDSKINVYCATCALPICVTGNDDDCTLPDHTLNSTVTWCSDPTATYYILVQGYSNAVGDFVLNLTDDGIPCTGGVECGLPIFGVTPTSVSGQADPGASDSELLTISNTGDGTLIGDAYITIDPPAPLSTLPPVSDPIAAFRAPIFSKAIVSYDEVLPEKRMALQGGDNIATATVIAALPFNDVGTTAGYAHDYDEICPYESPGGKDVVYSYTSPTDTLISITLCNGSAFDTKLYIYENTYTPGFPYACNDDACPGYVSEILALPVTGGNTYYIVIDGYSPADSGAYVIDMFEVEPPPPPPGCPPAGVVFGQNPSLPDGDWTFATSDLEPNYQTFESFSGVFGEITEVHFWAIDAFYSGGWMECSEDPAMLQLTFWSDAGGLPGVPTHTFDFTVPPVPTGQSFGGFVQNEFVVTLPTPVYVNAGWVSIQGMSSGDNCWFMWQDSPEGDGAAVQFDGTTYTLAAYDMAICLVGTAITPWLSIDVSHLEVAPGGTANMTVTMDAATLTNGTYNGSVWINANDAGLTLHEIPVTFQVGGGGGCAYRPGDINGNGTTNGIDVGYGVNYFKGGPIPPIRCDVCPQPAPFYAAGDVNGNCIFNGIDITFFVNYLKGIVPALLNCPTCPPAPLVAPAAEPLKVRTVETQQ